MPSSGHKQLRLYALNRAIESNPLGAVNYILRGEYWLNLGETAQAIADFEYALALGQEELQNTEWGYLTQALCDRAEQGLRAAGFKNKYKNQS